MSGHAPAAPVDAAVLREAADWLVRLNEADAGPADHEALQRWLAASPRHAQAWQRAEILLADIDRVGRSAGEAAKAAKTALDRPPSAARRRALGQVGKWVCLPVLPTTTWLAWQHLPWAAWSADARTATGEQRQLTLADGTQVLLNTASAINLRFTPQRRLLQLLAGEILVSTAADPATARGAAPRPFIVQTAEGSVRAIGTRFSVRRLVPDPVPDPALGRSGARSRVAVFAGAVELTTTAQSLRLGQGEQAEFGAAGIASRSSADEALDAAWRTGMLIARRMRLADLVAELDRYRPGRLRCHPALAELLVSGAFPLLDSERSLRLLEQTFPLQVRYRSRLHGLWATLEPADPALPEPG